jgi:hypothetical protein
VRSSCTRIQRRQKLGDTEPAPSQKKSTKTGTADETRKALTSAADRGLVARSTQDRNRRQLENRPHTELEPTGLGSSEHSGTVTPAWESKRTEASHRQRNQLSRGISRLSGWTKNHSRLRNKNYHVKTGADRGKTRNMSTRKQKLD